MDHRQVYRRDPVGGESTGRRLLRWFSRGGWYLVLVVLSIGMLSFVPFVHAALRLRRSPLLWLWAVLYTAAVIIMFQFTDTRQIGGVIIGLTVVATVHSAMLRRKVWSPAALAARAIDPAADSAVAAVLAARTRRANARRIAATDPRMARELCIGRPDLPRRYDDGGLVDLDTAPASALAHMCGIDLAIAQEIVGARIPGVPLAAVDDLFTRLDVPYELWDRIRDRGVVIPTTPPE